MMVCKMTDVNISVCGCAIVLFGNRTLPSINELGLFFTLAGAIITIAACASMATHASNSFVWKDWQNRTGWSNNGFVFAAGMLNGAYSVGTPDVVAHLAEELPR